MAPTNTEKDTPKQEKAARKLDLTVRTPLPGNRPIVPTNKDADMDDFVGYMD